MTCTTKEVGYLRARHRSLMSNNFHQTKTIRIAPALLSFLALAFGMQAQARPGDPEVPAIKRPVHISDRGAYVDPYIPVFRTTRDGRLSYNVKSNGGTLRMYINAPEKITQNYHDSANGPTLLARTGAFTVNTQRLRETRFGGGNTHTAVCELPDEQGNQRNPYACGNDDCYDVVFIQSGASDPTREFRLLQGTPGTIRVTNPKTPNARIASLTLGDTVVSPHRLRYQQLFEPMTTQDGNLLIGRVENSHQITWRNRRTNRNVSGRYDMVYMNGPDDPRRACDVTQWSEIKPLGHAPYDPQINTRYGFAMQRFRDAQGNIIPDNTDLSGSYPWIDADGDNIAFSAFGIRTNFPVSCVPNRACSNNNFRSGSTPLMGKIIAGLWTNGKMVLLDNLVNHIDYSQPQAEDNGHRNLDMYAAGTGPNQNSTGLVRIGHGRDNQGGGNLPANAENTTFVESIENKLNFWSNMRPSSPGDVVWHFSSGAGSDELTFDDFLYPDAFIISSMVQSTTNNGNTRAQFGGNNGRVQNASSATRWRVPAFGNVVRSRVETVALGGVLGKGLWLQGNSRIDYAVVSQPRGVRTHDWQISLFVDARFANDSNVRTLVAFPDSSELQLVGRDLIRYWNNGAVIHTLPLPTPIPQNGWAHVGVQMSNRNRAATFYLNGYALDTYESNQNFFEMHVGTLSVGDHPTRGVAGFRGWVDEFKVIALRRNPSDWCRQANGYLVGSYGAGNALADVAGRYPDASHQVITDLLTDTNQDSYLFYACYVDYTGDYLARKDTIPEGFTAISERIDFPEGPLVHDLPRPDSSNNAACLQCHAAGLPLGLGLGALTLNGNVTAANDPRRNPMQPPARVFGHIPANWLGEGLPASAMVAPAAGLSIDEFLLPASTSEAIEGPIMAPAPAPAPKPDPAPEPTPESAPEPGQDNAPAPVLDPDAPQPREVPTTEGESPFDLLIATLPNSRSVQVGTTATIFATVINNTDTAAFDCELSAPPSLDIDFNYQQTNSSTNAVIGELDPVLDLGPNDSRTFVISITPFSPINAELITPRFDCANKFEATPITGVNTVLFSATELPSPDLIALAVTPGLNDGILRISGNNGAGAFSVATSNIGVAGRIEVTPISQFGDASAPLRLEICQTDPQTANCLNSSLPSSSVTLDIESGAAPTFAIFAFAQGTNIPLDPAQNRVFVNFSQNGQIRGGTSVAVTSE